MSGHLSMGPAERADYLAGCVAVVEAARRAPGCLDFSLSADLLDPGRVVVLERWESSAAVDAFRGDGPSEEQRTVITSADVVQHEVASWRSLTG